MSVEVIIGRAGSGKTFTCLQQMKKILTESPLKTEIIFLLPAYQTYRAELELATITGGATGTRMCSFQRFAYQILSEVGGSIVPRISEIGRRLLLRKILLNFSKSDSLLYYKNAARRRGFAEILSRELKDLRTYAVGAENFRKIIEVNENLPPDKKIDEELQNKIHDFAILSDDFKNFIAGKQNDESDLIEQAADFIKDSAAIKRSEIFIDGFIFFDPQQRKILREIFQHARNVHVALPMDAKINSRENVQENLGLFNRSFKTFKMLEKIAEEVGADFKVTHCEGSRRFENDALKFIEQNFFSHAPKIFRGHTENLKIVEAVNKRVEVEAVARDILKLRRERGYRFREIGIIYRDESYRDLIKPLFEIHGIPFFVDGKRAAANHPLAELIRSALEVLRGWKAEAIFRCLRTDFFDAAREDIDLLENYVLEFGLRGEKIWTREKIWHWHRHNLEDAKNEPSAEESARLVKVDAIRREIILPLVKFSKAVGKKNSVLELTKSLFILIEDLKVHEKLVRWAEVEELRGDLSLSREHLKIWDDVVTLMEQIVDALGEEIIDTREFEFIINEGLDALEMSLIPPGIDEVTVAQFDQNALQNSRAIYILGFSETNFPKQAKENSLLSDVDRLHLNDAGLEISKGGRENMLAEKFLTYRGLNEAREYLHITYPLADAEGNAIRSSPVLDKLKGMFPRVEIPLVPLDVLKNIGSAVEYSISEKTLSPKSARELFAPNKKLRGSVTNLENFNQCPFKYFARYGLKLEERREYKVQPPDVGNILHAVMRKFGEELQAENRAWSSVEEPELSQIVTKIFDNLSPKLNNKILFSTNALQQQRDRIKKVAVTAIKNLIELDKVSKFHPTMFEKTFGAANVRALIYDVEGVKMELTGKIDRVDFNEDGKYFLIIDYKTGSAYLNLTEVFVGINLQLLTYLMAANKLNVVGEREPAGMLYYFLKYPVKSAKNIEETLKEIDKELKMPGWFLNNVDVIKEIDGSAAQDFIKIKLTNSGIHGSYLKNVKTEEEFSTLINFVEEVIRQTGKNILRGEIKAEPCSTPKRDACKFCIYSELCGFNAKIKSSAKNLPKLNDNEILQKMKNLETGLN